MKLKQTSDYLTLAINYFKSKDYELSLKFFSFILLNNPESIDAKIGILLSDFVHEDEKLAIYYFNRFIEFIEEDNIKEEILSDLLSFNKMNYSFSENFLTDMDDVLSADGIEYKDFKKILKNSQDIKNLITNIMFSTKLIISSRTEMLDFIELLYENNFKDEALSYLESAIDIYPSDMFLQDILKNYNFNKNREIYEN